MRLLQKFVGVALSAMAIFSMSVSSASAGASRHASVLPGTCEDAQAPGGASTVLLTNGRIRLRSNSPSGPNVQTAGVVFRTTDPSGVPAGAPLAQGVYSFHSNNNTPNTEFFLTAVGYYQGGNVVFFDEFNNADGNFSVDTRSQNLGQLNALGILYTAENHGRITVSDFRLDGRQVPISVASPQDCTFLFFPGNAVVTGTAAKAAGSARGWSK